jgi:pimeloyl-ACP methyl ester carboxylesterase
MGLTWPIGQPTSKALLPHARRDKIVTMTKALEHAHFQSFDGARLAYATQGDGRAVLLLHGFLASARFNWIDPGIAAAIAAAGFRAVMPDLRGHGRSQAPDAAGFPADVLAADAEALIRELGLSDFDLVGYSLGSRTAVRMLARGAKPRRCVLGGMGLSGIVASSARVAFFKDAIVHGEDGKYPEAAKHIHAMIKQAQLRPQDMLRVLDAQIQTPEADLRRIDTPILVVSGKDDEDNGSAEALARVLPRARAVRTPGNHLSAIEAPELTQAMVGFLRDG